MGLFDRKSCGICGERIGLLDGVTLADGSICGDCARKLSPFFDGTQNATLEQIEAHLAYREENLTALENFRPSKSFGRGTKLYLDEKLGAFVLCESQNFAARNPDLISLADVTGAKLDIPENRRELTRRDRNGFPVPYNPRRYEYSYNFIVTIGVDHPFIKELSFRLNDAPLDGRDRMGCQQQKEEGDALVKYLRLLHMQQEQKENRGSVFCPYCGAPTTPDEKGRCEYCGSVI